MAHSMFSVIANFCLVLDHIFVSFVKIEKVLIDSFLKAAGDRKIGSSKVYVVVSQIRGKKYQAGPQQMSRRKIMKVYIREEELKGSDSKPEEGKYLTASAGLELAL